MMKIEIKNKIEIKKQITTPCLVRHKDKGYVVFFINDMVGLILDEPKKGTVFDMFELYTGEVTLSN